MDKVVAYAQKMNPDVPTEQRLIRTVQAWGAVLVLWEALIRADKAGKLNGAGIREAIETLRDYEVGLGIPPITYTPEDHRPTSIAQIYIYRAQKFQLLERIDLKEKWPDKWAKEWLGW
jgi:branched-chain amino acid transport system substrate-binding protein